MKEVAVEARKRAPDAHDVYDDYAEQIGLPLFDKNKSKGIKTPLDAASMMRFMTDKERRGTQRMADLVIEDPNRSEAEKEKARFLKKLQKIFLEMRQPNYSVPDYKGYCELFDVPQTSAAGREGYIELLLYFFLPAINADRRSRLKNMVLNGDQDSDGGYQKVNAYKKDYLYDNILSKSDEADSEYLENQEAYFNKERARLLKIVKSKDASPMEKKNAEEQASAMQDALTVIYMIHDLKDGNYLDMWKTATLKQGSGDSYSGLYSRNSDIAELIYTIVILFGEPKEIK